MVNREWAACVRDDAGGVGGWRLGGGGGIIEAKEGGEV